MPKITLNNAVYFYEEHQVLHELPSLLMLHGFMGSSRVFDHLLNDLSKVCNPITVDLLGHGQSEEIYEPTRYRKKHQIKDMKELIKHIASSALFLYGYSMGGRLALKTALEAPELFTGLILESTTCGIERESERAERREEDRKRALEIRDDFDSFLSKWGKLKLFKSDTEPNPKLKERYQKIQENQDPRAIAASLSGFSTGNMQPVKKQLRNFPVPVLLLAGSRDEKYTDINNTMAQLFTTAEFKKLKAGHRVHLDNPAAVVNTIKQFIAKH